MRNLNKYLIVIISGIFALSTIVIGAKYTANRQPSEGAIEVPKKTSGVPANQATTNGNTVADLFLDDQQVFLSEEISDAFVKNVEKDIDKSNPQVTNLLKQAQVKWEIQKSLNALFVEPVLVGKTVKEEAVYKELTNEVDKQHVTDLVNQSGLADDFIEIVKSLLANERPTSDSSTGEFSTVDLTLLLPSEQDTAEIQQAKEQLGYVVQNGEVVSGFTMDGYLGAKAAIEVLPEGELKNTMLSQLNLVEVAMENMGISYE